MDTGEVSQVSWKLTNFQATLLYSPLFSLSLPPSKLAIKEEKARVVDKNERTKAQKKIFLLKMGQPDPLRTYVGLSLIFWQVQKAPT